MDVFTFIAMIVVFCIGFLLWYNMRIFLRILDKDTLQFKDAVQSTVVGICCSFLFWFFT